MEGLKSKKQERMHKDLEAHRSFGIRLRGLHSSRSQFWERRVFTLIMRYVFTGSEGRKYETVKHRKHLD